MLLALLAGLLAVAPVRAAGPQLPGQALELKAGDGWTIKARYKPAADQSGLAAKLTVVLLHGRGTRKESWLKLARALEKQGYGVLAPDLRGHGESQQAPDGQLVPWRKFKATAKGENDFAKMSLDVQAAVEWLGQNGVAESSVALVGQDLGGSLALRYAAVHKSIAEVVMLSPGLNYQEVTTVNAMRAYRDRPILMIYGTIDRYAASSAPILYQFAKMSVGEQRAALMAVPDVHGSKLSVTPAVIDEIASWLGNPVPPPPAVSTTTAPGQPGEPAPAEAPAPAPAQ